MRTILTKQVHRLKLTIPFVLLLLISATEVFSQAAPQTITRAQFLASPLNIQRKYVQNMPDDFLVQDLVNYPVSRTPDATPRPGVTYMTVYDFYYNVFPGVRLDALNDPQHYSIARDSLTIPTPRIAAPAPHQTQKKD